MQTFLPYPSFVESARVLDNKRLGKQRVEAWQILQILTGKSRGWRNHPAVTMWEGSEGVLVKYGVAVCVEWVRRGFTDSMLSRFQDVVALDALSPLSYEYPDWFARKDFHAAHRSVLLAKNQAHYSQFGWTEAPAVRGADGKWPYVWPEATT